MEVYTASVEASDEKEESTAGHRRKGYSSYKVNLSYKEGIELCMSCAIVFVFETEIGSDKVGYPAEQISRPSAKCIIWFILHSYSQL